MENESAIVRRPDDLTRELLLYGDRYSQYKAAEYQIDALKDFLESWNKTLLSSIDRGVAYQMMVQYPQYVLATRYLELEEIDDKTPPEKIIAGKLNQIHRNYAALARLEEIRANTQMWARIAGAVRYSDEVLKTDTIRRQYGIATKMSQLAPISYSSIKESRNRSLSYEVMKRNLERGDV